MNTEELIRALTADGSRRVTPISHKLARALVLGVMASAMSLLILHPRPDLAHAFLTVRFVFKLALVISLAGSAAMLLPAMARPGSSGGLRWPLLTAPALLGIGVVVELATVPMHDWSARLIGHNAAHCLVSIPMLSLPPLAFLLAALREGAPEHRMTAGLTAGLLSGAVAATLYALTCPDDSPLFVLAWYSMAIALVSAVSAYASKRVLQW